MTMHVRKVAHPEYPKDRGTYSTMVGKGVITYAFASLSQVLLCT